MSVRGFRIGVPHYAHTRFLDW